MSRMSCHVQSVFFFISISLGAIAQAAPAAPHVTFGDAEAHGSGCPNGTVHSTTSPDQTALSILFDQFVARAEGDRHHDSARCLIHVPLTVHGKYQAQVVSVDYRGYNALTENTASRITAVFGFDLKWHHWYLPFYRNQRQKTFQGPNTDPFDIAGAFRMPKWTPCGQSVRLVLDTKIEAVSGVGGEAKIGVDSIDAVNAPIKLAVNWRRCE